MSELDGVLDHLVVACPDLARARRAVQGWGVDPVVGGRHGRGATANLLVGMSPGYLELVGPAPGQTPHGGMAFGIAELTRPVLRTWAATVDDPQDAIEAARTAGCDLGPLEVGRRVRDDGTEVTWQFTDPRANRLDDTVPFLIDWQDARHPSDGLPVVLELESLSFTHPHPERVLAMHAALGLPRLPVTAGPAGVHALLATPDGWVELDSDRIPDTSRPDRTPHVSTPRRR